MAKILYIEDDPLERALIRQVLEEVGHVVIEATGGLEGIQTVREENPDLVLVDLHIPGMDGFETATRIKTLPDSGHIPVIAVTGSHVTPDTREQALIAGCDGYLTKPLNVLDLPQQVNDFLSGRRDKMASEEESRHLREYNKRLVDHLEQKVQELTLANATLAHNASMKSRFIDLAAHELRTPLAVIHGYLSMLTSPGNKFVQDADQNTLEIIDGISTGIDRLRGIVQDMLDVTRIEAKKLQLHHTLVSVPHIFQKIQKEFNPAVMRRHQTLLVADTSTLPTFWADGERIIQILRNLVSNAIKYTPDYGTIEIRASQVGADQVPISNGAKAAEGYIKITVSDTGIGIDPIQKAQIFEHFYEVRELEHHSTSKTDFMGSGAGLGLPIARGVAQAHGGTLFVESEGYDPERCPGSQFHLILPLGRQPQEK